MFLVEFKQSFFFFFSIVAVLILFVENFSESNFKSSIFEQIKTKNVAEGMVSVSYRDFFSFLSPLLGLSYLRITLVLI